MDVKRDVLIAQAEGLINEVQLAIDDALRMLCGNNALATLGVVMIVKNEESCLEGCLKSVQGADEIVILDTGSTDGTGDIARRYTDKYFAGEYEWNDNFAEARNVALAKCTTDWVLSIDADERLDEGGIQKIKELIQDPGTFQDAMLVLMHNGGDQFYNVKVFRRGLQYSGRVHEYISHTCAISYSGVDIEFNISQSHQGDPNRNIRILEASARQNPFDPRLHYCMGREYFIMGYYPNAIYWFERYKSNTDAKLYLAEYADAVYTLALCYEKMLEKEKAKLNCMEAIMANADFREAHVVMARLSSDNGLNQRRWQEFASTANNEGLNFKTKGEW